MENAFCAATTERNIPTSLEMRTRLATNALRREVVMRRRDPKRANVFLAATTERTMATSSEIKIRLAMIASINKEYE